MRFQNANLAHKTASETVLHDIRIIAIDQKRLCKALPTTVPTAGEVARTVTLQVAPDPRSRRSQWLRPSWKAVIGYARSADQQHEETVQGTVFSGDVSPAIANQGMTWLRPSWLYEGATAKEFTFKTQRGTEPQWPLILRKCLPPEETASFVARDRIVAFVADDYTAAALIQGTRRFEYRGQARNDPQCPADARN